MASTTIEARAAALAILTGGKPEWYATRRALTAAEGRAGVEWDGAKGEYRAAAPGQLVRSKGGTVGRVLHGTHRAYAV